jgi:hypothetical protein
MVVDYPLTMRHRDGTVTEVLYNASIYRDAGGNVQGEFAAARDVTKLMQAQREVAEQSATGSSSCEPRIWSGGVRSRRYRSETTVRRSAVITVGSVRARPGKARCGDFVRSGLRPPAPGDESKDCPVAALPVVLKVG